MQFVLQIFRTQAHPRRFHPQPLVGARRWHGVRRILVYISMFVNLLSSLLKKHDVAFVFFVIFNVRTSINLCLHMAQLSRARRTCGLIMLRIVDFEGRILVRWCSILWLQSLRPTHLVLLLDRDRDIQVSSSFTIPLGSIFTGDVATSISFSRVPLRLWSLYSVAGSIGRWVLRWGLSDPRLLPPVKAGLVHPLAESP